MADKFNIYSAIKEWCEDKRLDSQHRDILLLIVNKMNALHWLAPVSIPISLMCKMGQMHKNTFLKKRKELIEFGWLEYMEGETKTQSAKYKVKDTLGLKENQPWLKIEPSLGLKGNQGLVPFCAHIKEEEKRIIKEGGEAASVGEVSRLQGETLAPEGTITPVENERHETMIELTPHPDTLVSKKEPRLKRSKTLKVYTPPKEIAEPLKVFLGYPGFKEAWQSFKAQHEKKRGKMSSETKDLLFRDIVKWSQTPQVAIAILEYSIKGSYPMLYEPKKNTQFQASGSALPSAGAPKNPNYKDSWD